MPIPHYPHSRISSKRGGAVRVARSLCFYNPREVYSALTENYDVRRWLEFISNQYVPRPRRVLLLYPCSAEKPYHVSQSYRILWRTLSKLGPLRHQIHVMTISEPFGLVPEEFYGKATPWHDWNREWYDCPGLFRWWCRKYKQPYEKDYADKSIQLLASYVARFLKRVESDDLYSVIIAFVRTYTSKLRKSEDHTHRRMIETASRLANAQVKIVPPKSVVSKIVRQNGRLAWDMYGVAHPTAQEYLLNLLLSVLKDGT